MGELQKRGVGLKVLTGDIDTTTSTGRLIFGMFATLAEFERDLGSLQESALGVRDCLREGARSYVFEGQRYSPVRLMCSQPSGERWGRSAGSGA